jgi:hypothetical protein
MAGKKREDVTEEKITGLKYFDRLLPLFAPLREVGCDRDTAGNRQLFMDQYCSLILLSLFNPIVTSLRGLQQASELKKVQRKLGCRRASLGSLSEATQVFEPERLEAIVEALLGDVKALPHDARLDQLKQALIAVDGTLLKRLPQITQTAWQSRRHPNGWRLHTQFEILRGMPRRIDLTDGRNRGGSNEKQVLRNTLEKDCCYVTDRGYEQYSLFNAIVDAGSSYVCRVRADHHFTADVARPLRPAAAPAVPWRPGQRRGRQGTTRVHGVTRCHQSSGTTGSYPQERPVTPVLSTGFGPLIHSTGYAVSLLGQYGAGGYALPIVLAVTPSR